MLIALEAPSSAAKKALEGVGLTTDQVAIAMHKSLPGALQMITEAVGKKFPAGSAEYLNAMKNISGGMRQMQGMLILTSQTGMKNFSADVGIISKQVQQGGQQIAGWNLVQGTFNQQMARLGAVFQTVMIQLGEHFLPIATQVAKFLADTFAPAAAAVATPVDAIKTALHGVGQPLEMVGGAMRRLTDPVRKASYAVSTMTEPLHTVGGAMRSMVGGVKTLHTEYSGLIKPINDLAGPFADLLGEWAAIKIAMQQASKTLNGDTQPVLNQLHDFFVHQLLPAVTQFADFVARTLIPAFTQIADFTLKYVIPAIIQLVGWFTQHVLPILEALVKVIITNVVPVIESLAKTIIEKWIPPLERIGNDVLPLLIPLLQLLGWIFQHVIGPVLGMVADNIGKLLGGIADLADGISQFVHNPGVNSFVGLMKGIANAGSGAMNVMSGGLFSKALPHFAAGGMMDTSGLALVGENGPEVAYLPGGTQITPVASMPGASSGMRPLYGASASAGGARQPVELHVDGRKLAQAILPYLPDAIRQATGARHM
jgi:phage-related protein